MDSRDVFMRLDPSRKVPRQVSFSFFLFTLSQIKYIGVSYWLNMLVLWNYNFL